MKKKDVKQLARQMVLEFIELQKPARARRAPTRRVARKIAKKTLQPEEIKVAADRAERKPIVVSDDVLQRSRQKAERYTRVNPFKLPDFPVQLMDNIPVDRRMASDEAITGISAWAGGAWNALGSHAAFEGIAFLGYQYLAELAQRPEYRVMVETIATEMTRKWIRIQAKGDKDKTKKIAQLNEEFERLKVRETFCQSCEVDGFFGRAHLYLDTGDTDDWNELKMPIGNGKNGVTEQKFGRGDLKRLAVVEPMWTYPTSYNSNNPLRPDWYNPQSWFVMDREVHVSRLLKFVGRPVPDALKPAYSFGGLSLTQMAKPYVENFLNIRQSVADIVQAFSVFVLSTNMGETLTPGGDQLFKRVDLFNNTRDNRGVMVIDAESEEFQNVSTSLASLDMLQAQAQEHQASVSRIPLVKLLGISPHGLNATAEPELRAFYDHIHAKQEQFFSPNLDRVFRFAQINIWGRVDPDLFYTYEPLWELDEKGQADVRKVNSETAQIQIDSGVISPEEERKRVANAPDTLYPGLNTEDMPDLKEEEDEGLEPKGGAARGEPSSSLASDEDFTEADHPRDDSGRWEAGGGGAEKAASKARAAKFGEASKGISEARDNLESVREQIGTAADDIMDITPEDRAELEDGEEFTAESDFRDAIGEAPAAADALRKAAQDMHNRAADLLGAAPIEAGQKSQTVTHIGAAKMANLADHLEGLASEVDDATENLRDHLDDPDADEDDVQEALDRLQSAVIELKSGSESAIAEMDQIMAREHDEVGEEEQEFATEMSRWGKMSATERKAEQDAQRRAEREKQRARSNERETAFEKALAGGWKPKFNSAGEVVVPNELEDVRIASASPTGAKQLNDFLKRNGVKRPGGGASDKSLTDSAFGRLK